MTMETATLTVALGGDIRNTVSLVARTPAEAQLLREIHGPQGILDIHVTDVRDVDAIAEVDYLRSSYPNYAPEIRNLFPGSRPNLPETFSDAGFDNVLDAAEEAAAKRRPGRPKKVPTPPAPSKDVITGPAE